MGITWIKTQNGSIINVNNIAVINFQKNGTNPITYEINAYINDFDTDKLMLILRGEDEKFMNEFYKNLSNVLAMSHPPLPLLDVNEFIGEVERKIARDKKERETQER